MKRILVLLICLISLSVPLSAADYSFGGDSTGTTGVQCPDSSLYTDTMTAPANSGYLDSAVGWVSYNTATPCSLAFVCYDASGNVIDSTAYFAVTVATKTRYRADFINGVAISSATQYQMGVHARSAGVNSTYKIYCSSSLSPQWKYINSVASIPATLAGASTTGGLSRPLRFYYSDAATPEQTGRRRKLLTGQ